jgi:plasmid stabilization system protein ParE
MAKRKIVWSHSANIKLFQILDFYAQRNGNKTYSIKLYKKFVKELKLLKKQPEIGILTDLDSVRGLVVDEFILFYEINEPTIIVLTVWDSRQNPDNLIL